MHPSAPGSNGSRPRIRPINAVRLPLRAAVALGGIEARQTQMQPALEVDGRPHVRTALFGEIPLYRADLNNPEEVLALQVDIRDEVFPYRQIQAVAIDFGDEGPDGWGGPWIFTVLHGEGGRKYSKLPLFPLCRRMYEGHACLDCTPSRMGSRHVRTANRPLQIIHKGNREDENLNATPEELMDSLNAIKEDLENAREGCRIRNILTEELLDFDVSHLGRALLQDFDLSSLHLNRLILGENTVHGSLRLHGGVQQRLLAHPGNTNVVHHEAFLNINPGQQNQHSHHPENTNVFRPERRVLHISHNGLVNRQVVFDRTMAAPAASSAQFNNGPSTHLGSSYGSTLPPGQLSLAHNFVTIEELELQEVLNRDNDRGALQWPQSSSARVVEQQPSKRLRVHKSDDSASSESDADLDQTHAQILESMLKAALEELDRVFEHAPRIGASPSEEFEMNTMAAAEAAAINNGSNTSTLPRGQLEPEDVEDVAASQGLVPRDVINGDSRLAVLEGLDRSSERLSPDVKERSKRLRSKRLRSKRLREDESDGLESPKPDANLAFSRTSNGLDPLNLMNGGPNRVSPHILSPPSSPPPPG